MVKFKVITGNAKEVEETLNNFRIDYEVSIKGFSATNETTTVLILIEMSYK